MPVLPLERFIWPDNLLSSPVTESEEEDYERDFPSLENFEEFSDSDSLKIEGDWWVLHTRPRAEKSIARELYRMRIPYFLPLHERSRRVQRRLVKSYLPLFPGYVFLRGGEDSLEQAYRTRSVANCLYVEDQEKLTEDLQRVYTLIQSGGSIYPESVLHPGAAAEIVSGPLSGWQGTILRKGSQMRFVISVDFLQQGASIEVEESMIEPLS